MDELKQEQNTLRERFEVLSQQVQDYHPSVDPALAATMATTSTTTTTAAISNAKRKQLWQRRKWAERPLYGCGVDLSHGLR